ncbi:MAG: hypothetical protein JNL58_25005 [Planctomyces sp.]|nr:hypothetical protein [Planctomyces sp.]
MRSLWTICIIALIAFAAGCGSKEGNPPSKAADSTATDPSQDSTNAQTRPHGGQILEIGDTREFHAELVFDSTTRNITLYFYGSEIGTPHPASELIFEPEVGGKAVILAADPSPLDGESTETCSCYVVSGKDLPSEITATDHLEGHFHVTLNGTEYEKDFDFRRR